MMVGMTAARHLRQSLNGEARNEGGGNKRPGERCERALRGLRAGITLLQSAFSTMNGHARTPAAVEIGHRYPDSQPAAPFRVASRADDHLRIQRISCEDAAGASRQSLPHEK
jgi:hypothetical protein